MDETTGSRTTAKLNEDHLHNNERQFLETRDGRQFNTVNEEYPLPADDEEWNRLNNQHSIFVNAMGAPYPCPEVVEAVLTPSGPDRKRVLDVGCGSGAWAIDIARLWPEINVKGLDLAPVPTRPNAFPPNVEFEMHDLNLGLSHLYGQFDLIHWRLVQAGVKDVPKTIEEVEKCLKLGGLFLIVEVDFEDTTHDWAIVRMAKIEGDEDVPGVSDHGSWTRRMNFEATAKNLEGYPARDMVYFDRGFWEHPMMDPSTAKSGSLYIPVGSWASSTTDADAQLLKDVGFRMYRNISIVHVAWHPILLRAGIPQSTIDEWSRLVQKELDTQSFPFSIRFGFSWARRRAGENLPAPPLPEISTTSSSPHHLPAPFWEIFNTQQEAFDAIEKRRAAIRDKPTPYWKRLKMQKMAEEEKKIETRAEGTDAAPSGSSN